MPRLFAQPRATFDKRRPRGRPSTVVAARAAATFAGLGWPLARGLLFVAFATSCESGYSLEPTFCDYWCRATLRADCGERESNCVRDCELTKASSDCFSLQERLLSCYEQADDEQFVCARSGFANENRVSDDLCQTERDQLFECEAPGIGSTCLTPCRLIQSQLNQAGDNRREVDAGASCPLLTDSCETWCWTLFSFSSDELAALGVPVTSTPALSFMPPSIPDSGLADAGVERANPLSYCLELLISE